MIPKASEDLYGYKQWRNNLKALQAGTVLRWVTGYVGHNTNTSIKAGQFTKIAAVQKFSVGFNSGNECDWSYQLVVCDENGKEFKKKLHWAVEGIARRLDDQTVVQL